MGAAANDGWIRGHRKFGALLCLRGGRANKRGGERQRGDDSFDHDGLTSKKRREGRYPRAVHITEFRGLEVQTGTNLDLLTEPAAGIADRTNANALFRKHRLDPTSKRHAVAQLLHGHESDHRGDAPLLI